MSGNRFRYIDSFHFFHLHQDNATTQAASEIIENPEKHLLTQSEVFAAEGGYMGLAT